MRKIFISFTALVIACPYFLSNIINVPGSYSAIQAAINSSVNGDTVLVQPGTYFENINFRGKQIVLTSLYYQTNNPATISLTIINGSTPVYPDTASCVIISSGEDSTTVLQGFTITGGGGTRWEDEHGPGFWYREGGGILIQYSSPVIQNNIIHSNNITNASNVTSTGGGGIRCGDSYPRLFNNIIMNNSARYGAGFVSNYTGGELYNNVICSNFGSYQYSAGSGLWIIGNFSRPLTIINNSIVNNSATSGIAGVYCAKPAVFYNNIVWGNTSPSGTQIVGPSLTVRYCDVQGGYSGAGNMNADPNFSDSSYILTANSPCVDKGDSSSVYNDPPDPNNPSAARYPARGTLRNDIGAYGGPLSRILTNAIIGINPVSNKIPSGFSLKQNYPNPFNPSTHFEFLVPELRSVKVIVYDIAGREVATLVNQYLQPGTYRVKFDANGLSSGIYFYELITNEIKLTRKMVLAR